MSKSILVIDADSCKQCPAGRSLASHNPDETWACEVLSFMKDEIRCVDKYADYKPDWCPLVSMPERKQEKYPIERINGSYVEMLGTEEDKIAIGWNMCIDEFLKGASSNE